MADRLLDRQRALLDYLTSASGIFGDGAPTGALRGLDAASLRLEAKFSYEKRMRKIAAVFPKTFERLGRDRDAILRAFVAACPPAEIGRLANARQFHDFLAARWRHTAPALPYLPDLAACELACATAIAAMRDPESRPGLGCSNIHGIRRSPGVVLLRCSYDVAPIFAPADATRARTAAPRRRDTRLAVTMPPGAERPRVVETPPSVFDLLGALDDWTDPAAFGGNGEVLVTMLRRQGLLEVCHGGHAHR